MIIPPNSFSKPSFRKHSCFEKLFVEGSFHQHYPDKQAAFPLSFSPSPPSKKPYPKIYTCMCFFLCFFITMAAFVRCNNSKAHVSVEKETSVSRDDGVLTWIEKPAAMPALKGLGSVYRKGTKVMSELVIAHIEEHSSLQDLRLFLRILHRSGVTARADIVFVFGWDMPPSAMVDAIHEENLHFEELMSVLSRDPDDATAEVRNTSLTSPTAGCTSCQSSNATISPFNINAFRKSGTESEISAPLLWGTRNFNASRTNRTGSMRMTHWGSVVGFDVSELNPDDALQGFIDKPPLVLRRWACYQMLLGMVRHKFKHILLTDVRGVAILRDPFTAISKKRVGLYLSLEDRTWGESFGDELGIRLGSKDAEQVPELEHVLALKNISNETVSRRQLRVQVQESASSGSHVDADSVAADDGSKSDMHSPGLPQDRGTLPRRTGRHLYIHRRNGGGGKRKSRKAVAEGGLYEHVYGRRMWSSLEENERKNKLVNSAVIIGSLQQVRGLANTMVTEIVKVALSRKNREAFPDSVLLSYLLHKSTSVLGKRVVEHLHLLDNSESFVHCLVGSQQPSFFLKKSRAAYLIIHGNSKGKKWGNVVRTIRRDLCSSPADAMVYTDCQNSLPKELL